MSRFDRTAQYEFIANFAGPDPGAPPSEPGPELAELVNRAVEGADALGLRLREGRPGPSFLPLPDGSVMPVRGKQWRTPGVWRLLWTEQRISLTFDALAYAEIRSTQADAGDLPTFQVVARRVARNFAAAAASLTRTNGIVNRATVSALGQGTAEKGDPAKVVAALHLNDGLKAIAARGEATDLSVAVNRRARWVLDGEAVEVNRHEALSSTWTIGAGESGKVLVAQVEVNTIPERQLANTPLSEAQLAGFFEQASTWVDERWKAIEAEACRV